MELSLERKVYGAVLLVALGGFAVDRLFLGGVTGPDPASAGQGPGDLVEASHRPAPTPRSPLATLSEKLDSFKSLLDGQRQDGFALPADLLKQLPAAAVQSEGAPEEPAPANPAAELVLRSCGGVGTPDAFVQVNGELLALGVERDDGMMLISLSKEGATDPSRGETFVAVVRDQTGRSHTLRMTVGGLSDDKKSRPKR